MMCPKCGMYHQSVCAICSRCCNGIATNSDCDRDIGWWELMNHNN